ncbi:hypothetical protein [Lysobacter capsici]|uniref:hypothetical protein n=1 Tax=Lysobacter capsici TaxID=435897 RepID=UPI00287BBF8F|nr:hypothetical protein [Lysobacter capsici]WND83063.1 hypothetical protein RJ610_12235 [Lysobacter capsici]WND88262.1 hypothetical protein RJ609_12245 [Lysobacter capsici]
MTKPRKSDKKPLASTTASESLVAKKDAKASARRVQYRIVSAPLDGNAVPGGKAGDKIVTDSASNLKNLPYAVTAAGDKTRVLSTKAKGKTYSVFAGRPFNTAEIAIPDDVSEVEIYLGNDAYEARRKHPVFKVTPDAQGLTVVTLHELPNKRLKRLQEDAKTSKDYPAADRGKTAKKEGGGHIGYLTGDVWKEFSYEFSLADVTRLCTASSLTRKFQEDRGRNAVTPLTATQPIRANDFLQPQEPARRDNTFVAWQPPLYRIEPLQQGQPLTAVPSAAASGQAAATDDKGNETLAISDWSQVLAPLYNGSIEELTGKEHYELTGYVDLPLVNIRLRYDAGSFANAVGASESVTPADVLKRTNPLTYKGLVEAAWKSGIDELVLSSTWRPMLGSVLHRMGVAVDVIFVDDYDDQTAKGGEVAKFKVHINSGKTPGTLYSTFNAIVLADSKNLGGFKADPWNRAANDKLHANHMHVSASDPDAK